MTGVRPAIRIAGIVVGVIAVVGVLAGVRGRDHAGGGQALAKDVYRAKVVNSSQELVTTFQRFSKEARTLSTDDGGAAKDTTTLLKRLAVVATDGSTELRTFADGLDDLTPPDDAVTANEMLVVGFNGLADDFASLGEALEKGSVSDVTQLAQELQALGSSEAGKSIQSAIAELERSGYDFGGMEEQ